jgi:multimeric flavodoxin WrbA
MKLIAINGSPRKGGNTEALLEAVMAPVRQAGIETELVQIGGKGIKGCLGCYTCQKRKDSRCSQNDDMLNACLEKVIAADALLLGSPTYFSDVTADMKAFIDRVGFVTRSNGNLLRRKVGAGVVAVRRAGATHALDTMTHLFQISGMIMPGSSYWTMGYGLQPREALADQEGVATMQSLGENIAWLMQKLAR